MNPIVSVVSHVIVLFDFIEEARERGETLEEALLDAGITLILVPVFYSISVLDLKLVKWEPGTR